MNCTKCPYATQAPYTSALYDAVEKRMMELMPGWFTKLDEIMDPYGAEPDIINIATIVAKTNRPIDDVIHEEMYEDWFQYHDDYDEDW